MDRKSKKILLLISLLLMPLFAFGATRLYIVAPGETFTPGGAKTGSPSVQTAGVPFTMTVYSINDTNHECVNTNAHVTLSANAATSFSPRDFFLTQTQGITPTCKSIPINVTLDITSNGNSVIKATDIGGQGLPAASVTITGQVINNFLFSFSSTQKAGEPIMVTITARDAATGTVTSFNGTANLVAHYSDHSVDMGTVTFTAGVARTNQDKILYEATRNSETVYFECTSTVPAMTTNSSGNFTISPNDADRLLIIGPGQTQQTGVLTGNGRIGGSEYTTGQTAGVTFTAQVIVCDAYWNTVTSDSSTSVTLASTDGNMYIDSPSKTVSSGIATFQVNLKTVGPNGQTLTATGGGFTQDADIVPMTNNSLDHFVFTDAIANTRTGGAFFIKALAVDAYENTITNYTQTGVTLELWKSGDGTQVDANNWNKANINFTNGVLASNAQVIVYQNVYNVYLKMVSTTAKTGTSTFFDVNAYAQPPQGFSKLLLIVPGQTADPGDRFTFGVTGTPSAAYAGTPVSVNLYATDTWGNKITSITNRVVRITSTDSAAVIGGNTLPQYVTLVAGEANFSFEFRTTGSRSINANDTQSSFASAVTISVQSAGIQSFDITAAPTNNAGASTSITITARDTFGNVKSDFTGIVYISSPDTDWTAPDESTIALSGTNVGSFGYKWAVTFTAQGSRAVGISYRRVTGTARLFCSTVYEDTRTAYTGLTGTSSAFSVVSTTPTKLQVLVPGMTSRPGTADGEIGSPLGFSVSQEFTVTVNLVDNWFNIITGSSDQIELTSNFTTFTQAATLGGSMSSVPVTDYMSVSTGTLKFRARYNSSTPALNIIANDIGNPSRTSDETPNISIFTIDRFKIGSDLVGSAIADQKVGVPFWVTITAYSDFAGNVIATGFNGSVQLSSNTDYSASDYTMEPRESPAFVNGVCRMQVTMYAAATSYTTKAIINATFGGTTYSSDPSFSVFWDTPTQMLVLPNGMEHRPGLGHLGRQGYAGYSGSPVPVIAGDAFGLQVMLVDQYYNRVYTWAGASTGSVNLSSTNDDLPYPASVDSVNLATNVSLVAGRFNTSNMVLRKVITAGGNGSQRITANLAGFTANTCPPISVKHASADHFEVVVPPSGSGSEIIAGVPFYVTIQAMDQFENLCDNTNQATPYNKAVTLSENSGFANSLYPTQLTLSNGSIYSTVRLFKAPMTERINVTEGSVTGQSADIYTGANIFQRLVILAPGMSSKNGQFTAPPPQEFVVYQGAPSNLGVSDGGSGRPSTGYPFWIFACDAYGNVTTTADINSLTITVTTNDPYSPALQPSYIAAGSFLTSTMIPFHKAMLGVSVTASISDEGIESFTTPSFATFAGDAYGFQTLVPGLLTSTYGSGGVTQTTKWNNGITGEERYQFSGTYFPVTLQACDVFGNTVGGITDTIEVYSDDTNGSGAVPDDLTPVNVSVVNGKGWFQARFMTQGTRSFKDYYCATPAINTLLNRSFASFNPQGYPDVNVVTSGNLKYLVFVGDPVYTGNTTVTQPEFPGVPYGNGISQTAATAAPATFPVTIWLVDDTPQPQPVYGTNRTFDLEAVLADNTSQNAGGTLKYTSGLAVSNGELYIPDMTYSLAQNIRIAIRDHVSPTAYTVQYSSEIDMSANSANACVSVTANPENLRSGRDSVITAHVGDQYGNDVGNKEVIFTVTSGSGYLNVSNTSVSVMTDDESGNAAVNYTGAYVNEKATINAYYPAGENASCRSVTVTVNTSLVDPLDGVVSNYPNPFMAGMENTYISFLMPTAEDVNIKIYTLFGDLVYEKSISAADIAARIASSGSMITEPWDGKNSKGDVVGNGGYICIVDTVINGEKKKIKTKIAVQK